MAIDLNLLLKAYASGIFPMADARDDPETFWVEPQMRAILPLDKFRCSRSLHKTIRANRFRVTADTDFAQVIDICAQSASDRQETWINAEIEAAFNALHQAGYAHSVECWRTDPESGEERLVGGLYGLAQGRVFCGESMFSRESDASKVALAWLVARLNVGGYTLLDCQFITDHLASMGAIEMPQEDYLDRLQDALAQPPSSVSANRSPIKSAGAFSGAERGASTGAGLTIGGAAAGGAAGVGAGVTGVGTGPSSAGAEGAFEALDVMLARLDDEDRGAVGSAASLGGLSSPGKLISHLLTQTS